MSSSLNLKGDYWKNKESINFCFRSDSLKWENIAFGTFFVLKNKLGDKTVFFWLFKCIVFNYKLKKF